MLRRKNHNNGAYSNGNKGKLVHGGKEYFDVLLQLINDARKAFTFRHIFSEMMEPAK
jgi:hypothetical protein